MEKIVWRGELGCLACLIVIIGVVTGLFVLGVNLFSAFGDISFWGIRVVDWFNVLSSAYISVGAYQLIISGSVAPLLKTFATDRRQIVVSIFVTVCCLLTWPILITDNVLTPLSKMGKLGHTNLCYNAYSLFVLFLISLPLWGVYATFFFFARVMTEGYGYWLFVVWLTIWPGIPFLNLLYAFTVSPLVSLAWLFWAPVVSLFLPKQKI